MLVSAHLATLPLSLQREHVSSHEEETSQHRYEACDGYEESGWPGAVRMDRRTALVDAPVGARGAELGRHRLWNGEVDSDALGPPGARCSQAEEDECRTRES